MNSRIGQEEDGNAGNLPLARRILAHAQETPQAPAVIDDGRVFSYAQLLSLAQSLAAGLPGPHGTGIGIIAHKSARTIALILGTLLVERPALLLAPTMSTERQLSVMRTAGIRTRIEPGTRGEATTVSDADHSQPDDEEVAGVRGGDLLFTTSGTTGTPKVVPLQIDAIDRFVAWATAEFELGPASTLLNLSPLNFDLTLLEVWTTLANGGCVVLVPPERAVLGSQVLDLVEEHAVDVIQAVPTFFTLMLASARGRRMTGVRTLILTGDRVDHATVAELRETFPVARIVNIYGMTETNDSFLHVIRDVEQVDRALPIGQPLPGVRVLVRGDDGSVSPFGVGELFVSTPFQAQGYLDPVTTSTVFVTFRTAEGPRVYVRTGDLVDRQPDAPTHLLGRMDRRVKVRGVAIDLADVERIFQSHPGIAAAAAIAEPDVVEGNRLVVVVQRATPSDVDLLELRSFSAHRLARGSAPSEFHLTDSGFPMTITGKIDRPRALLAARGTLERN